MKKEQKLNLPDSCQVLNNDEMMQSEGGWYIDISERMLLLSNKDLKNSNSLKNLSQTLKDKFNVNINANMLNNLIVPVLPIGPGQSYGIGIKFNLTNLNESDVWRITDLQQAKLANSNKIVF